MTQIGRLKFGLHTIAIFEAAKGGAVLLVGLGLLPFVHKDLQDVGEQFIHFLNLNPHHKFPGIFIRMVDRAPDIDVIWLALAAFVYSGIRLAEAYGLWKDKVWAEWLAITSGALYLPFEFYELFDKFTWFRVLVICGNILIVIYLIMVRHTKLKESLHLEELRHK